MIPAEKENGLLTILKNKTISLQEINKTKVSPLMIAQMMLKQLEKVNNISLIKGCLAGKDIDRAAEGYPFKIVS